MHDGLRNFDPNEMFAVSETLLHAAYNNRHSLVSISPCADMGRQYTSSFLYEASYGWSVGGNAANIRDNTPILAGHFSLDGIPQTLAFECEKRHFDG